MDRLKLLKKYLFKRARYSEDLLIITNIAIFVYIFAAYFNVFDFLYEITRPYKRYGIDNIISISIILVFVLIVFAISLWRDVRREAREKEELQEKFIEQTEEIRMLWEGGKQIASVVSMEQILPWIADQASKLLDGDVYLNIPEENCLVVSSAKSSRLLEMDKVELFGKLSKKVTEEKKPLIINNLQHKREYKSLAQNLGYFSFIGIPLQGEEGVEGTLNVISKERERFEQQDISSLSYFADQAVMVLKNTKLYDDLEVTKKDLEKLNKELEARVAEKTDELKKVYSMLINSERFAATGRLASSIANEINNPLQAIESFISSVMDELKDREPKSIGYLKLAREGVKKIANLTRNLVAFHSRKEEIQDLQEIDFDEYRKKALSSVKNKTYLDKI